MTVTHPCEIVGRGFPDFPATEDIFGDNGRSGAAVPGRPFLPSGCKPFERTTGYLPVGMSSQVVARELLRSSA